MIIHFIANFPHDLFELKLKFNMDILYEKKMRKWKFDKRVKFVKQEDGTMTILTVTGHSALLVCMLNEKNTK
jgi:selenocysteine-specific translation elongation factor